MYPNFVNISFQNQQDEIHKVKLFKNIVFIFKMYKTLNKIIKLKKSYMLLIANSLNKLMIHHSILPKILCKTKECHIFSALKSAHEKLSMLPNPHSTW